MKTFTNLFAVLALTSFLVVFVGCSSDIEIGQNYSYLDFDTSDTEQISVGLIQEAVQRIDKYVSYEGGQFMLSLDNPDKIALSQRVFSFMKSLMNSQNETIRSIGNDHFFFHKDSKSLIMEDWSKSEVSLTRAIDRGRNYFSGKFHWYGFDAKIGISHTVLVGSSSVVAAIGLILSAYAPEPVSKMAGLFCGLIGIAGGAFASAYPSGVIISCVLIPGTFTCVPYELREQ